MKKTIWARNVQTVCNIKLNPWLDISGSRSGFLVPALWFWILWSGSRILSHISCVQVIGPVFWILDPRTQVSDPVFWVSVYSVIITKSNKKLWQSVTENYYKSVTGITTCGRYCKVWQKTITKCRRYYKVWKQAIIECDRCKVWQLLPSET